MRAYELYVIHMWMLWAPLLLFRYLYNLSLTLHGYHCQFVKRFLLNSSPSKIANAQLDLDIHTEAGLHFVAEFYFTIIYQVLL